MCATSVGVIKKPSEKPKKTKPVPPSKLCKACRFKDKCLGKTAKEKKFSVTYYREAYERNNKRLQTAKGKAMKSKRQSTVEPVFGTLTQFMGLREVNTIGVQQATKVMQLSATVYNLKKYLKFTHKKVKSGVGMGLLSGLYKITLQQLISFHLRKANFTTPQPI
jgi:hypothetical protein